MAFTLVVGPTDEVRTQLVHGDAHVLGHCHGQGSDGGGLVDHHQQVPVVGQVLVESTQALLFVGQGPLEDLPACPGSGPWPSARSYRRPVPMKTSMSSILIFVPPLAAWVRGQPVADRPRTHACERPHPQRAVPLISGHQRPAAAGDFRPRIIYGQGQDTRAHSNWPGPRPPGTTNKVTGNVFRHRW